MNLANGFPFAGDFEMRVRLLAANICGAVLVAGAAQAADLSTKVPVKAAPAPAFTWTGFYIGAQGGYASASTDFSGTHDPLNGVFYTNDANYNLDGGFAGGVIGYNYQIGNAVLGIEADANWADLTGSGVALRNEGVLAPACIATSDPCSSKIDAFGTITGRLGGAIDRVLIYIKAGAAWATTSHTAGYTDLVLPEFSHHATVDATRWGWTLGAGVEWAFFDKWSAKLEYNYIDLGNSDVTFAYFPAWTPAYSSTVSQNINLLKAGVNYRF